jgi:A/G-specific adenine glycosylase
VKAISPAFLVDKSRFRADLLHWYRGNRRELPWRRDRKPYRVWVSEIMLQQTRVAAVVEHYQRFLKRFPTVEKLAAAREGSVLAAWSGLGYYRRARMLHAAAKQIVADYDGQFPGTAQRLRTLPGIGRYTAAAIASITFGEAAAVVDGNVERVLTRLLGQPQSTAALWKTAEELLAADSPGDFNQAMMELGATICLPKAPLCLACPVQIFCKTRGHLASRGSKARQKKQQICYALSGRRGSVFLVQRGQHESLMAGMWELPQAPVNGAAPLFRVRHSITVTDYDVLVVHADAPAGEGEWISSQRLARLPLTGLARKILTKAELM